MQFLKPQTTISYTFFAVKTHTRIVQQSNENQIPNSSNSLLSLLQNPTKTSAVKPEPKQHSKQIVLNPYSNIWSSKQTSTTVFKPATWINQKIQSHIWNYQRIILTNLLSFCGSWRQFCVVGLWSGQIFRRNCSKWKICPHSWEGERMKGNSWTMNNQPMDIL